MSRIVSATTRRSSMYLEEVQLHLPGVRRRSCLDRSVTDVTEYRPAPRRLHLGFAPHSLRGL